MAEIAPLAGGDWLLIDPEQTLLLDIRLLLETHDGALVYVLGPGRVDGSRGPPGPRYLSPMFETSDPRDAWLNRGQPSAARAPSPWNVFRGTAKAEREVVRSGTEKGVVLGRTAG